MGVFEVGTLIVQALFMLMLLAIVPIGWSVWADPSRNAASFLRHAQGAQQRGDHRAALRLAFRAMTFPTRGRYTARQASTTAEALGVLASLLATSQRTLPEPAQRLHDSLHSGQRDVGTLALEAEKSLEDLPDIDPL